jgi:hypothetical protein
MSVARRTIPWHAGCFTKSREATRSVPVPQPRLMVDNETPASVDQRNVIAWLATPGEYGAGMDTVERIDTDSSVVFLVGNPGVQIEGRGPVRLRGLLHPKATSRVLRL